jgi:ureidoacrylate peracid hydrolase
MLETLSEKVDPKRAAILIIDMQNDFCHPEGRAGRRGMDVSPTEAIVPQIKNLVAEARRVAVPVIFARFTLTQHTIQKNAPQHMPAEDGSLLCEEGTWGAEFYQILPEPGDAIVTKHRYSAFIRTDLDLILRNKGIESLILTGTRTNICVESTARDAQQYDYYPVVLSDCTASGTLEAHERGLLGSFGVTATSEEVIEEWHKLSPSQEQLSRIQVSL